jgi:hypothetical protein
MAMVALNFLSLLFVDEALPMRASVSEDFCWENYYLKLLIQSLK